MKYIFFSFFILFFISCDNELNVVEDYKDIPIVYGFLSLSDTAQYMRIERAFIDESTSGLELAQIPDSLYYLNASVFIEEVGTSTQYQLERVDGNLEGYVREEGAFAQSPNYLYKINTSDIDFIPEQEYKLIIDRGNDSELIEASTILLGTSDLKNPDVENGGFISFKTGSFSFFTWSASEAADIFNLYFDFNYRERGPETNGSFIPKTVTWKALQNFKKDAEDDIRVQAEIEGASFFTFLKGAIPETENIERRFDDITVRITSGGREINNFVEITSANLGITSTQDPPFFSNISEGRGIFSSTHELVIPNGSLTNQTLDSIREGQFTLNLGFQ